MILNRKKMLEKMNKIERKKTDWTNNEMKDEEELMRTIHSRPRININALVFQTNNQEMNSKTL